MLFSLSLPYFFKYLFKENEDFSVFGFILLNIMWNNQRAIHLVALTTLMVLSILCHPFTIYCTKRIIFLLALHFERTVERLWQYDSVISKWKAGKKWGRALITTDIPSAPPLSVLSVVTVGTTNWPESMRKGKAVIMAKKLKLPDVFSKFCIRRYVPIRGCPGRESFCSRWLWMEHGTTTSTTLKDKPIPINDVLLVFGILSALNYTKLFKDKNWQNCGLFWVGVFTCTMTVFKPRLLLNVYLCELGSGGELELNWLWFFGNVIYITRMQIFIVSLSQM